MIPAYDPMVSEPSQAEELGHHRQDSLFQHVRRQPQALCSDVVPPILTNQVESRHESQEVRPAAATRCVWKSYFRQEAADEILNKLISP